MNMSEFGTMAKKDYAFKVIKSELHIDEFTEVVKVYNEIDKMFDDFIRTETKCHLVDESEGRICNICQYKDNKDYYISQYAKGKILVTVQIKFNDLDDFNNWYKN